MPHTLTRLTKRTVTAMLLLMATSGAMAPIALTPAAHAQTTGVKQAFSWYIERGEYFGKQVNLHMKKAEKAHKKGDNKTNCKELNLARDNAYYYSIIAVDAENFYPDGEQGDLARSMLGLSDEYRGWVDKALAEYC
jgi:hypothetical protein